ncbi:MAG TPA: pyroglutamyl-peptidase I [Hyphomicrobium sp.]
MASRRPIILLTGFGPFPGVDSNATAELIPELAKAARAHFHEYEVIDEVLPVEWSRGPQALERLLAGGKLVLALHFGVSHGANGFQIELVGRNLRGARPDASGQLPSCEAVIATGPAVLAATLPAERIVTRLTRAGFPCCTSDDAGDYLCNALMYHSLTAARTLPTPFISGFIHVPANLQATSCEETERGTECVLTWDAAVAGSIEIIAACLGDGASVVAA